ncbi:MAG: hypothetical protein IOD12_03760 [Silvanigrellales bacterium]|nr:hypothetical protein [Silvanigrellales bacterium]
MADGILWHLGAGVFFAWLAFHFLSNRRRAEELEGGFVTLVAWEGEPPKALVLRAMRFLEAECFDVLGTPIRLEQPPAAEAPKAAALLFGRLSALRREEGKVAKKRCLSGHFARVFGHGNATPGAKTEDVPEEAQGTKTTDIGARRVRAARWSGSQWELI